ncbi:MAG: 5-(carboxyamino)imidazole ribonucleotide mutase [Clostridiales bacterium]|nr:5-(carboxyamino)imidazole ribonucleotide mutase [Clostridiales bacterium]
MAGKVLIVMGSDSDWSIMESAAQTLAAFQVEADVYVASAHRTPERALDLSSRARERGYSVIIAGAGAAAHLAGVLASKTTLPVIGVPLSGSALQGLDALYATVQMPSGVPVATVAIDGAKNAALLAIQILAVHDSNLAGRLALEKEAIAAQVEEKDQKVRELAEAGKFSGGAEHGAKRKR